MHTYVYSIQVLCDTRPYNIIEVPMYTNYVCSRYNRVTCLVDAAAVDEKIIYIMLS